MLILFKRDIMLTNISKSLYEGRVSSYQVPEGAGLADWQFHAEEKNDLTDCWGALLQKLLRGVVDGKSYHINAMYIEFDNSGGPVTPPVIDPAAQLEYFNGLTGDQDYLRVPIIATSEEKSDPALPLSNVAVFLAHTSGSAGVNGLTFSNAAGSRIYGGALVAMLDEQDPSQDIVFARWYFSESGKQLEKLANAQIGIKWKSVFQPV